MEFPNDYDGVYFLPGDEEDEMKFAFFHMKESDYDRAPIEGTGIGDKFHIAFFRMDEEGDAVFDEEFEAIFADPMVYLKNLIGMELYGCVVRKTKTSGKWWDEYLNKALQRTTILKTQTKMQ
jgi:hypothetical protein